MLTVTGNKKQLINLIVIDLQIHKGDLETCEHFLIVTGADPIPVHIEHNTVIHRHDMMTTQEEADVILIQQVR